MQSKWIHPRRHSWHLVLVIALWLPMIRRPVHVPRLRRGAQEALAKTIVLCGWRMLLLLLRLVSLVRRRIGSYMTSATGASLHVHAVVAVLAVAGGVVGSGALAVTKTFSGCREIT